MTTCNRRATSPVTTSSSVRTPPGPTTSAEKAAAERELEAIEPAPTGLDERAVRNAITIYGELAERANADDLAPEQRRAIYDEVGVMLRYDPVAHSVEITGAIQVPDAPDESGGTGRVGGFA